MNPELKERTDTQNIEQLLGILDQDIKKLKKEYYILTFKLYVLQFCAVVLGIISVWFIWNLLK